MNFNSTTTTTNYPRWQPKSKILREKRLINQAMNKRQKEFFDCLFKVVRGYQITRYST